LGLRGDADPLLLATHRARERRGGEIRPVVLLRKVRRDEVAQGRARERGDEGARVGVAQMAEPPRDALLERGGKGPSIRLSRSWLHSITSASQCDSLSTTCCVTVPRSVTTPRRAAPSENTYCTGSRASCGTGNGSTATASIANGVCESMRCRSAAGKSAGIHC